MISSGNLKVKGLGCFPLCQRFLKIWSEFKWKGPFRFLPTGIFRITFGGGPLISVGIFRSKFAVPFLTNRFFALIREFGNDKIVKRAIPIGWLRFNRNMRFHFPWVVPLVISLTGRIGIMESNPFLAGRGDSDDGAFIVDKVECVIR